MYKRRYHDSMNIYSLKDAYTQLNIQHDLKVGKREKGQQCRTAQAGWAQASLFVITEDCNKQAIHLWSSPEKDLQMKRMW